MKECGEVLPTLFVVLPDGSLRALAMAFRNVSDKNFFIEIAKMACVAYDATCMAVIAEAWMSKTKPDETPDTAIPPAKAPDRQECMVVTGESSEQYVSRFLPIIRTAAGAFSGFGKMGEPVFEASPLEGRFTQLLPPKKPTRETRRKALAHLTAMGITF